MTNRPRVKALKRFFYGQSDAPIGAINKLALALIRNAQQDQGFSLQIGGRPTEECEGPRVPVANEYLSFYDSRGVQEFYIVTRVVWSARRGERPIHATVYAVPAQP